MEEKMKLRMDKKPDQEKTDYLFANVAALASRQP
jgi:hypothetical protein